MAATDGWDLLTSPAGIATLVAPRGAPASETVEQDSRLGRAGTDPSANGQSGDHGRRRSAFFAFLAANKQTLFLGAVVLLATSAADFVASRARRVQTLMRENFYVVLEVRSHQAEYPMLMEWLSKNSVGKSSNNMALRSIPDDETRSTDEQAESRLSRLTRNHELLGVARHEHREMRRAAQLFLAEQNGLSEAPMDDDDAGAASMTASTPAASGWAHDAAREAQQPFVPGYGLHRVRFRDHTVWVSRDIDMDRKTGPPAEDRSPDEVLTFTIVGWKRAVLEELLVEAKLTSVRDHVHSTRVLMPRWGNWELLTEKPKRYLDSVFLPQEIKTSLRDEMATFFKQRDVYRALGVPWRRGYLFYGPPGTGKTTSILALAGEHNLSVYVLPLDDDITDTKFLSLVNAVPPTASMLIVEDLDTAITGIRGGASADEDRDGVTKASAKLTLSGVLNALDGIASSEGRVLIVTSNTAPERLPPALLRPGRIDRVVTFGMMERPEMESMLRHFACPPAAVERLVNGHAGSVSPAQVQAALQLRGFKCDDKMTL